MSSSIADHPVHTAPQSAAAVAIARPSAVTHSAKSIGGRSAFSLRPLDDHPCYPVFDDTLHDLCCHVFESQYATTEDLYRGVAEYFAARAGVSLQPAKS